MTPDQKKQYEEAAKEYLKTLKGREYKSLYEFSIQQKSAFILGCEYAHSKIEEAEREAWNRAIDEAAKLIWALRNEPYVSVAAVNDEIQKLRK